MLMSHANNSENDDAIATQPNASDRRASVRALKYWKSRAHSEHPPRLADINLSEAETGLENTFLLRVDTPVDRCVIIACGNATRDKLKVNHLGGTFADSVPQNLRKDLLAAVGRAVLEREPQLAEGDFRTTDDDGDVLYRAAFLPVADVRQQICYVYAVFTDNRPASLQAVH